MAVTRAIESASSTHTPDFSTAQSSFTSVQDPSCKTVTDVSLSADASDVVALLIATQRQFSECNPSSVPDTLHRVAQELVGSFTQAALAEGLSNRATSSDTPVTMRGILLWLLDFILSIFHKNKQNFGRFIEGHIYNLVVSALPMTAEGGMNYTLVSDLVSRWSEQHLISKVKLINARKFVDSWHVVDEPPVDIYTHTVPVPVYGTSETSTADSKHKIKTEHDPTAFITTGRLRQKLRTPTEKEIEIGKQIEMVRTQQKRAHIESALRPSGENFETEVLEIWHDILDEATPDVDDWFKWFFNVYRWQPDPQLTPQSPPESYSLKRQRKEDAYASAGESTPSGLDHVQSPCLQQGDAISPPQSLIFSSTPSNDKTEHTSSADEHNNLHSDTAR